MTEKPFTNEDKEIIELYDRIKQLFSLPRFADKVTVIFEVDNPVKVSVSYTPIKSNMVI